MANYGSNSLVVSVDITDGGALTDISAYILSINGVSVEKITEDSTYFGLAWMAELQSGMSKLEPIVLEGFYNDAASTGPDVVFNIATITHAATRTFKVLYGASKSTTVEVWIRKYERLPSIGKLTRFRVTLNPTGTPTEA